MALDTVTTVALDDAATAINEWKTRKVEEIISQADFLRRIQVPVTDVTEDPTEQSVDAAEALIASLLATP